MALSFMLAVESSSFAADSFPSRSNWVSRELWEEIREGRMKGEEEEVRLMTGQDQNE